jgi:hypothetical protein
MTRFPWLSTAPLVLLACGGAVASEPSGSDAGAALDATSNPEAAPLRPPRDPVECSGGTSIAYDKSCTTSADCVVVTVYVGCCRSDALGCNRGDAARLADAGATCVQLDPCDCAGNAVTADDGHPSVAPGQTDVSVACTGGSCVSSVP